MSRFEHLIEKSVSIKGEKHAVFDRSRGRAFAVLVVFAVMYFSLAVKLLDIVVIQGSLREGETITAGSSHASEDKPIRSSIYDRNGNLLAASLEAYSLYADPKLMLAPKASLEGLLEVFPELDRENLKEKLESDKRFVWIARNLTPDEQYRVLEIGEPGFGFIREPIRIYPQGNIASHVVGYVNIDGKGLAGIERAFDEKLSKGEGDIYLSTDIRVQHYLRKYMAEAIKNHKAKGGAGIVIDVESGEVIASVSLPDFDPYNVGHEDKVNLFNRFSLGAYEAGSIFKIFSTAALLELESPGMSTKFDVREPLEFGKYTIKDLHPHERKISLPEVFAYSSNIGSAMMGIQLGEDKLKKFYSDLGLMNKIRSEIPEKGSPLIPSPWRDINTLTASYGHGIAVTPLQISSAVATVIGDGGLITPTFIKRDDNEESEPIIKVMHSKTVHKMRQLLRLAVMEGTGSFADIEGYSVGGKTGTAEKISKTGEYDRDSLLSSFVGVFPMTNPEYVILVMIDEPQGNKSTYGYATGGWVAAPVVGKMVSVLANLNMIPKIEEQKDRGLVSPLLRYIEEPKSKTAQEHENSDKEVAYNGW